MVLQTLALTNFISQIPFDLKLLPPGAYLVGGAVRDTLLARAKPNFDLDFVVPEGAIAIARKIANHYQAGFVVLDEARQIARVVFDRGTLDFALQVGNDIISDLQRRDFTIDAIAYDCYEHKIIDPLGGIPDLERAILRMISRVNLTEDPLRLLRAYRLAAQLNFTIADATRATIRQLAPAIAKVAAERVQTELNYLLANPIGDRWLQAAWEDNLLQSWLPNATPATISELKTIELAQQNLATKWHNCQSNRANILFLAKLATLVTQNPDRAKEELTRLKYSRVQIESVVATVKYLPQLLKRKKAMSLREQYQFFIDVKAVFPVLITRALALKVPDEIIFPSIERYLDPQDPIAYPQSLVTGNDLIEQLNLKPSPAIGTLLTEIQIAYIEGKISTFSQAIDWARAFDLKR